jgi:hypothetical protein
MRTLSTPMIRLLAPFAPLFSKSVWLTGTGAESAWSRSLLRRLCGTPLSCSPCPCDPLHTPATRDRSLVMSRGQRSESARRLYFLGICRGYADENQGIGARERDAQKSLPATYAEAWVTARMLMRSSSTRPMNSPMITTSRLTTNALIPICSLRPLVDERDPSHPGWFARGTRLTAAHPSGHAIVRQRLPARLDSRTGTGSYDGRISRTP